jgi:hypothetical protein
MDDKTRKTLEDETEGVVTSFVERFEALLEEWRSQGGTGVILLGISDPLTECSFMQARGVGGYYSRLGMVESYRNALLTREST